jgi:hypothetical protein
MTMQKFFIFILLFIQTTIFSQEKGIAFKEGTLDDALLAAKQSDKPLFVYVYGTACHFCRIMEKDVFPDNNVSLYYNTTFVDYKINLDEENGKALDKKFHISGTPTYLFFDRNGNLIHLSTSEKKAAAFIQDGKNALDSNTAYVASKNRYVRGDRSRDFLYSFSNMLLTVTDSPDIRNDVEEAYLKGQDKKELSSKKNLEYIFNHATTMDGAATKFYFDMQKPLRQLLGEEKIKNTTMAIVGNAAMDAGYRQDSAQLHQIKTILQNIEPGDRDQLSLLTNVKYSMGAFQKEHQQWKPYAEASIVYGRKYAKKDYSRPGILYESASYLFYFTDSKEPLQKGLQIIDIAIAAENDYYNIYTKARLLHKLGQEKKALAAIQGAIKIASPKDDTQDAKDLIEEIKKSTKK